jgi:hypothetical protein
MHATSARILTCLLLLEGTLAGCASLPTFGADLGKQEISGALQRPPYTAFKSFFGYIAPGAEPDEVLDGKKLFYVYAWVPSVTPELGVRMLSPAKRYSSPKDGDFVDAAFTDNPKSDVYFDTWIRLERCLAAVNPEDINKPCPQWVPFGENDDSAEVPEQPNGTRSNSLMRIHSSMDDPTKTLARGVYRIAFTTAKVGEVQGSYLVQVGAPIDLPGLALARSPAELVKALGPAGILSKQTPVAK